MSNCMMLLSLAIAYLGFAIGDIDREKGKGWRISAIILAIIVWGLTTFNIVE